MSGKRLLVGFVLAVFFLRNDIEAQLCTVAGGSTAAQYINSSVTLKILLVEFADVKHRTSPSPYKASDFANVLVSSGVYVSPDKYSPDGEAVYGSLNDYFNQMSNGNLNVTGFVINQVANDIPVWISLSQNKVNCHNGADIFSED